MPGLSKSRPHRSRAHRLWEERGEGEKKEHLVRTVTVQEKNTLGRGALIEGEKGEKKTPAGRVHGRTRRGHLPREKGKARPG